MAQHLQPMRVTLAAILLGLFGFARPFVNCSPPPAASLAIETEDHLNISNSISTLLLRNLSDVFGENDPVRRRAAIAEIFHEDAVFYAPKGGIFRGRDEIDRIAGEIRATHHDFRYQPIAEPEEAGNGGRVRWVEGHPGHPLDRLKVGIHALGYVADTDQQAADEFFPGYARSFTEIGKERGWPPITRPQFEALLEPEGALLVGDPRTVADKILSVREALGGIERLSLQMNIASLPHAKRMHAIELLGAKVAPAVREHFASGFYSGGIGV